MLAEFLYDYVTRVEGRKKILQLLEKEKGAAYVPNLFVPTRAAYIVWKLEDMKPRWDRAFWLKTLTGDDLEMYRNRDALPAEEKARLIAQVLELQNTLDDLSSRVDNVKEENLRLRSENQVLGQYIENLMAASSVFQPANEQPRGSSRRK